MFVFTMLQLRFLHQKAKGTLQSHCPVTGSIHDLPLPFYDFYGGLPRKPSPFLQQTVARFEKCIGQCRQWIEELEQLPCLESERNSFGASSSLLESFPRVLSNFHGFFVHVAAKVEGIHQHTE